MAAVKMSKPFSVDARPTTHQSKPLCRSACITDLQACAVKNSTIYFDFRRKIFLHGLGSLQRFSVKNDKNAVRLVLKFLSGEVDIFIDAEMP